MQRAEVSSRGGGSSAVPDEDDAALLAVPVGEGPTSVDLSIGDYRMVATQSGDTIYVIGQPAGGAQDVIGRLVVVEVVVSHVFLACDPWGELSRGGMIHRRAAGATPVPVGQERLRRRASARRSPSMRSSSTSEWSTWAIIEATSWCPAPSAISRCISWPTSR